MDNGEVVRETVYAGDSDAFDYWILDTRGTFARCAAFPSCGTSLSCSRVGWAKTSTKTSWLPLYLPRLRCGAQRAHLLGRRAPH